MCLRPKRGATVGAGRALGLRGGGQTQRFAFGNLRGADQIDRLFALRHLDLSCGEDLLLGRYRQRARRFGFGVGFALRLAFPGDRDGSLLLGQFQGQAALDFGRLDRPFLADALLLQGLLGTDARGVDRLLRGDLRAFGILLPMRTLGAHIGPLACPRDLDLALLAQPCVLAFPVDLERQLFGFEVLVADGDQRVLLDVVALLLAVLDLFGQAGQSFGVKRIARVEKLHARLVELRQRRRFEFETVLGQILGDGLAHALDVDAALLVQLLHGHVGGRRAQGIDELALDQLLQLLGLHGAQAERLRGIGHRIGIRRHAHVELGDHVHPHAILGDQRFVPAAHDFEPQGVHVHGNHVVDDRQDEGATVEHDPLTAQAGAYERTLFRAAKIKPMHQPHEQRDDDRDDDQAKDEAAELGA